MQVDEAQVTDVALADVAIAVGYAILGAWEDYCRTRDDAAGLTWQNMRVRISSRVYTSSWL